MANLTDEQRVLVGLRILQQICEHPDVDCTSATTRNEVLSAASAADQWLTDNQASYNAALPQPFRTWATPRQKAAVLHHIMLQRFNLETDEIIPEGQE